LIYHINLEIFVNKIMQIIYHVSGQIQEYSKIVLYIQYHLANRYLIVKYIEKNG